MRSIFLLAVSALLLSPLAMSYEPGTANQIMRVPTGGGRPTMGSINLASSAAVGSTILPVANGGNGIASGTSGGIHYFSSTSTVASSGLLAANQLMIGGGAGAAPSTLAAGSQYQVMVMGASNPGYGQVNLGQSAAITGTLPVGNGGTGATSLTTNAVLVGNGTSAVAPAASSILVNQHSANGEICVNGNCIGNVNGGVYPSWGISNGNLFHATSGTGGQDFGNTTNGFLGGVSGTGVWTFGQSSGSTTAGTHQFFNNSTSSRTLYVQNLSTSTSSDGVADLILVKGSGTTTTAQVFEYFTISGGATGSGFITANGASTAAFGTASDARLKKNIEDLTPQLDNITKLRPVEFEYRKKTKRGAGRQVGFIAQEMQQVYPDSVGVMSDGYLQISGWDKTSARLVKALQELKAQNDALRADFDQYKHDHP